jgi:hypothetical protein
VSLVAGETDERERDGYQTMTKMVQAIALIARHDSQVPSRRYVESATFDELVMLG